MAWELIAVASEPPLISSKSAAQEGAASQNPTGDRVFLLLRPAISPDRRIELSASALTAARRLRRISGSGNLQSDFLKKKNRRAAVFRKAQGVDDGQGRIEFDTDGQYEAIGTNWGWPPIDLWRFYNQRFIHLANIVISELRKTPIQYAFQPSRKPLIKSLTLPNTVAKAQRANATRIIQPIAGRFCTSRFNESKIVFTFIVPASRL
nr:hypothetical protein [Cohnella algarum]